MEDYLGVQGGCVLKWISPIIAISLSLSLLFSCTSPGPRADEAIGAAYQFLYRQMDRLHDRVIVVGNPEYAAFFPSGIMGDRDSIAIDRIACGENRPGRGCLRINYRPTRKSREGWAGIYFQYPEDNWGSVPGRNLTGATRLSFWARSEPPMVVEFGAGGIKGPRPKGQGKYSDSFGPTPVPPLLVRLTKQWHQYSINLRGENLKSVLGAFKVVVASGKGGKRGSIFLDNVDFDLSLLEEPRFLQSYVPSACSEGATEVSYVYDQALVLLALLARGSPEDLRRAELIARALVEAQQHDRFYHDGRLRNAYASGPLVDPNAKVTRLPGQWDAQRQTFLEDEYSAGSDSGNAAWAGLALIQAHKHLPTRSGQSYLRAARRLGDWIVQHNRVNDRRGGFRGGYEDFEPTATHPRGQTPSMWRSTEHNIDLVAFFGHLADVTGRGTTEGKKWADEESHARMFVERMYERNAQASFLWIGTTDKRAVNGEPEINKSMIPLDAQTWSVLWMGQPEKYEAALSWAMRHCGARSIPHAYDFNCMDGDGAWWEGTSQVATALNWLGREEDAAPIMARLRSAQVRDGASAGAMPAASKCGLTTGLYRVSHSTGQAKPWSYPDSPHIGATAWYIFALLGRNPYHVVVSSARR